MVGDYPKADVQALLKNFKKWEQSEFKPMELGVRKSLSIVTCMDSRELLYWHLSADAVFSFGPTH